MLKIASVARTVNDKIEHELANELEVMVKTGSMKDMYSGSTGFDALTKIDCRELRNNMQSFKEKIELVVAMNANYNKAYKKASVVAQKMNSSGASGEEGEDDQEEEGGGRGEVCGV